MEDKETAQLMVQLQAAALEAGRHPLLPAAGKTALVTLLHLAQRLANRLDVLEGRAGQ